MRIEEWLGNENELGISIWNKKYKFENETFDEWIERISNNDADVAELIKTKKFLFAFVERCYILFGYNVLFYTFKTYHLSLTTQR